MSVHDTRDDDTREQALEAAVEAVRDGRLIVLPTDTVYGIGADAFAPEAVQALLDAKGRGRDTPPPVLVGDPAVLMALAVDVPEVAERLAEEFWPGPLTLILTAQPSLTWDLGETRGTVALRMPEDEVALELLRRTGPLAVSSANRHGRPAAQTVLDAATQLGDAVDVYLDGGTTVLGASSTIIDMTVDPPEIVRDGALSRERIIEVLGDIFTQPEPEDETADPEEDAEHATADTADGDASCTDSAHVEHGNAGSCGDEIGDPDSTPGERTEPVGSNTGTDSSGAEHSAGALNLPREPELHDLSDSSATAIEESPLQEPSAPDTAPGDRPS
ncbi:L-threonylcarbamoyladenylate synthase [Brachybacterium timonense]|uniref:L-threonylcarbamoyladenylate synthase n=1 Tax=Brachybacterium timonense TaxID=2050896 RepID=UPI000D0B5769|nr:L-threonylcarbamoyladenylate synthase [Brachybacterium timonense]